MRQGQVHRGALVAVAVLLGWVLAFHGFIVVAPWINDVMPVEEAARRCPGSIDPAWPAVVCSHGRPMNWELGLFADNPMRYSLAVAELTIGLALFFYGVVRLNRLRHERRD
jgi:hypothetical protein